MGVRPALVASSLAFLAALHGSKAWALTGSTEKAAAESLFQDGVALMQQGKAEAACEKFAASEELDPALGTMLRLADCYDRIGKTASAWALFEEAASVAQARGERPREAAARERVVDIGKRLSRLKVQIASGAPAGLVIKLNGTSIPRASWDGTIPVDPGDQVVEASAPGFQAWTGHAAAPAGPATTQLEVPALTAVPASAQPAAADALSVRDSTRTPSDTGQTQRTVALVVGGVGVASWVVAGVTSYLASARNHDSRDQCRTSDPNLCNTRGIDLRDQALSLAKVSTVTAIAGTGLVVGGVALWVIKPGPSAQARNAGVRVLVSGLPGRAMFSLESAW